MALNTANNINLIREKIESIKDFPKQGIIFRDIFSVLREPPVFKILIDILKEKVREICPNADGIVGLDSRGFIFGSILAYELQKPFVPIRKKGKLPGDVAKRNFTLEYGEDTFEVQKSSIKQGDKIVIVDDLLATGGTMTAAAELVASLGAEVSLCLVCIELADLSGRDKIGSFRVESVVQF